MRIEVLVKYAKPKKNTLKEKEEEKETRKLNRILGRDDYMEDEGVGSKIEELFSEQNLEFFYKPYVIDTRDIHDMCPYDEEHVLLLTEFGGQLPVKMSWIVWKALWEAASGEKIFSADNVPFPKKNNKI